MSGQVLRVRLRRCGADYRAVKDNVDYEIERVECYDRLMNPPSYTEWRVLPRIKGRGTFETLRDVRAALEL